MRPLTTLFLLFIAGILHAQDFIYLRDGRMFEGHALSISDSLYLENAPLTAVPVSDLYYIKYGLGEFKAFRGHFARRHRDKAHVFHAAAGRMSIGLHCDYSWYPRVNLSVEYFLGKRNTNSIRLMAGLGTDKGGTSASRRAEGIETLYGVGFDYLHYITLERKVRFYHGLALRCLGITESNGYWEGAMVWREQRKRAVLPDGGYTAGCQLMLGQYVGLTASGMIGMSYFLGGGRDTPFFELSTGLKFFLPYNH